MYLKDNPNKTYRSLNMIHKTKGLVASSLLCTSMLLLSGCSTEHTQFKLYSISTAINEDRKGYYDILDKTTNLFKNREFNITPWLEWNLNILKDAMVNALANIEYLIEKTKLWDKHRDKALNE